MLYDRLSFHVPVLRVLVSHSIFAGDEVSLITPCWQTEIAFTPMRVAKYEVLPNELQKL